MPKKSNGNHEKDGARQQNLPLHWDEEDAERNDGTPDARDAAAPEGETADRKSVPVDDVKPAESTPARECTADDESDAAQEPTTSVTTDTADAPEAPDTESGSAADNDGVTNEKTGGEENKPPAEAAVVALGDVSLTVGERLQEARGAANMTVSQVAQKTKIPKQIVEYLETDRTEHLPPAIYTRSYLTQLCREYAIAPDPILEEYDRMTSAAGGEEAHGKGFVVTAHDSESGSRVEYTIPGREGMPKKPATSPTVYLVSGVIIGLVVLVLSALAIYHFRHTDGETGNAADTAATIETTPGIDLEKFVVPQQLPQKELPVPEN